MEAIDQSGWTEAKVEKGVAFGAYGQSNYALTVLS